jgi:hypothetical protein
MQTRYYISASFHFWTETSITAIADEGEWFDSWLGIKKRTPGRASYGYALSGQYAYFVEIKLLWTDFL